MNTYAKKRITCFGGGTGLSSLLSGLKKNPWLEISAVVSMFDSGGSSGVLRDRFGILPPSDILRCLLALSADPEHARELLLRRLRHAVHDGHTGGNILLMGLEQVYGNYEDAISALGQLLAVTGRAVPVSLDRCTLCAEAEDGAVVFGEVEVDAKMHAGAAIRRLFLEPPAAATPAAIRAVESADAIIIGPGSFYTSVLPNFLPAGITAAAASSSAPLIFVANLLTEGLGMSKLTLADLAANLENRLGRRLDAVIANSVQPPEEVLAAYAAEGKAPLRLGSLSGDPRLVVAELWTDGAIARHDPDRLAALVASTVDRLAKR